jgi:hypothetical protein
MKAKTKEIEGYIGVKCPAIKGYRMIKLEQPDKDGFLYIEFKTRK